MVVLTPYEGTTLCLAASARMKGDKATEAGRLDFPGAKRGTMLLGEPEP